MARRLAPHFKRSLWDRLTDPAPAQGPDVGVVAPGEVERIKDSVRRDLEWLLNSKRFRFADDRRPDPVPHDVDWPRNDKLPEGANALERSLISYGLPDITSLAPGDAANLKKFRRILEDVIREFEPRLSGVVVSFTPPGEDEHRASLHYRIDAMLRLDPSPEPIVFDTVLDLANRAFSIRRDGA